MRKLIKAGVLCVGLLILHGPAAAALGETGAPAASAQTETSRQAAGAAHYSVHETRLDSGTLVREYVSAGGTVFAVAWQGPSLPDLRHLLGKYFADYTEAAKVSGRGPLRINNPELVVRSGGRLRAFSGQAYLPRELPENFSIGVIQ